MEPCVCASPHHPEHPCCVRVVLVFPEEAWWWKTGCGDQCNVANFILYIFSGISLIVRTYGEIYAENGLETELWLPCIFVITVEKEMYVYLQSTTAT